MLLHDTGGVGDGVGDGVTLGVGDGVADGVGDGVADGEGDGVPVTVNEMEHCPAFAAFGLDAGAVGAVGVLPRFSSKTEIDTTAIARTIVKIVPPMMRNILSRRFSIGFNGFIGYPSLHIHLHYMVDIESSSCPTH